MGCLWKGRGGLQSQRLSLNQSPFPQLAKQGCHTGGDHQVTQWIYDQHGGDPRTVQGVRLPGCKRRWTARNTASGMLG